MKKTTLLALAVCAGMPVLAEAPANFQVSKGDSNVTFYGILDAGLATVSHSLDFDAYHPVATNPQATKFGSQAATGLFNGGISQTRLGIKGETLLMEGLKGVFVLEGAFNIPNGNLSNAAVGLAQTAKNAGNSTSPGNPGQPNNGTMSADSAVSGQLFARAAYLGLSSDTYGSLTFGRHTSFMLDIIPGYDALQGAQLFTPIGFSGSYGGGGATDNSRVDSSVKYKIKCGDFNAGLMHKFGGVAGSSSAKSADQFIVGYEHGAFGIQAVYESFKDALSVGNPTDSVTSTTVATPVTAANPTGGTATILTNAQPLGTVAVTAFDTKSYMLTARYKIGDFSIKGGYQKQEFTNPSDPALVANITSIFGQVVSSVNTAPYQVGGTIGKNAAGMQTGLNSGGTQVEKDLDVYWIGVAYDVTPKLNIAVGYYSVKQNDFSAGSQPIAAATPYGGASLSGTSKFTSLLVDYRFNNAFDAYLGYMTNTVDGGMNVISATQTYTFDNNSVTGIGLRYKF